LPDLVRVCRLDRREDLQKDCPWCRPPACSSYPVRGRNRDTALRLTTLAAALLFPQPSALRRTLHPAHVNAVRRASARLARRVTS
jgi:hypothetical protein